MNDILSVADQKLAAQTRIRNAISGIKRQIVARGRLTILDRLLGLVVPDHAYGDHASLLCFVADLHRNRSRAATKWGVVLHNLGSLLVAYWTLTRYDESVGLAGLLQRVEDYARYGFEQCNLLGDMENGFYLFNRAAQDAAVAEAKRAK